MNIIVLELINDTWKAEFINRSGKIDITKEQFVDLINELLQREINDAYFNKQSPDDLIVLSGDLAVVFKGYDKVNQREEMSDLSKKINKVLLQHTSKIVFELVNDNWQAEFINKSERLHLTKEQFVDLINELLQIEINDAYFNKKSLDDLIILYEDLKVVIKDYDKVSHKEEMSEISKKINRTLLHHTTQKVKKALSNTKVKVTAISLAAIMMTNGMDSHNLIKQATDNIVSQGTTTSSNYDEKEIEKANNITQEENSNVNEDKIMQYFDKYCKIFGISDEIKNKLYRENVDNFKIGDTIESEIIDIIYSYYETNLYEEAPIQYNNYTNEEQEEYIIKYALIDDIADTDTICTMLAIHRLETGFGDSDYCRNYNNLGGVYGTNPNNNQYEIKKYPNLDVAAIDFVNVFTRIEEKCKDLPTYSPNNTLEYNMNPIYCTEKIDPNGPEWYEVIAGLKQDIKSEYQREIDNTIDKNTRIH